MISLKKITLLSLIMALFSISVYAQKGSIVGTVIEEKDSSPMPYVSVAIMKAS